MILICVLIMICYYIHVLYDLYFMAYAIVNKEYTINSIWRITWEWLIRIKHALCTRFNIVHKIGHNTGETRVLFKYEITTQLRI